MEYRSSSTTDFMKRVLHSVVLAAAFFLCTAFTSLAMGRLAWSFALCSTTTEVAHPSRFSKGGYSYCLGRVPHGSRPPELSLSQPR